MTYPTTDDGLRAALEALGATADDVSATLLAAGHVGVRGDCHRCPVAAYLEHTFPGYGALVADGGVELYPLDGSTEPLATSHPNPVAEFIGEFDRGPRYQQLATGKLEAA